MFHNNSYHRARLILEIFIAFDLFIVTVLIIASLYIWAQIRKETRDNFLTLIKHEGSLITNARED